MARSARSGAAWLVVALVVALVPTTTLAQDEPIAASVVLVGDVPDGVVLEAARAVGGAAWAEEKLTPVEAPPAPAPREEAEALLTLWADAQFSMCLAHAQTEVLDPRALIRQGHLETAATVLVYSSACALGAGDVDLARSLLERAIVADLPVTPLLRNVTIDHQRIADEVAAEARRAPRVALEIVTRPSDAEIQIDGRPCPGAPCAIEVAEGEHLVVAARIGHVTRIQPIVVMGPTVRTLALDPAAAATQRGQLAAAHGAGVSPGSVAALRTATSAYGTPVVLVAFPDEGGFRLALFDRRQGRRGRVVARGRSESGRDALDATARSLVNEWRDLEPRSVLASPWFWVTAALVVGAAVVLSVLLTQEPEPTFNLVGR